LLRKYVDNVFYVVSRNVKCDLKNAIKIYFLLKLFVTIRSRDYVWSFRRQFFWLFNFVFDEWRMSILDYRMTYARSRLVERRLWWNVIKFNKTFHQTHYKRFIKFDENDSSNLMNENVISSNLTKAIHQIWWRYLIKFSKRKTIFFFWWVIFCNDI
jgi:hypothetical protein